MGTIGYPLVALVVTDLFISIVNWKKLKAESTGLLCLEKGEKKRVEQWMFIKVKRWFCFLDSV